LPFPLVLVMVKDWDALPEAPVVFDTNTPTV